MGADGRPVTDSVRSPLQKWQGLERGWSQRREKVVGGVQSRLEVEPVGREDWLDSGSERKEGSGTAPRLLAGAEAESKGRGKLGSPTTPAQPLHRWSLPPPATLIMEQHLSSQKMKENPLKSIENVS